MNRARQPAPHPRAIATSGTFQSTLYRAFRQTLALLGLTGDWPSSSHTGNRADYLPHIIEKVYMRTINMNTVLEFSSTSVHQAAGQVETTAAGLAAGAYSASVTITETSQSGSIRRTILPVMPSITGAAASPAIQLRMSNLTFSGTAGGANSAAAPCPGRPLTTQRG
jgi:hypothetical protein